MRPCVLLWTPLGGQRAALADGLRSLDIDLIEAGDEAAAIAALERADAALLAGVASGYTAALAAAVRRAPRLRFVQLTATGTEGIERHGVPPHVVVASVGPTMAAVVAEHALALMLALVRRIPEAAMQGSRGVWNRPAVLAGLGSLEGKTLCLVGFGRIGKEIARRAHPFGMACIAVNRSGRNDAPELADPVFPVGRLPEALGRSDVLAISLPDAPDTRRLFDAPQWAACRPGALVVNVGRGSVIHTDALVAALASGHIAGAGLDVTEPEPLPEGHPLWSARGALITPHVAGGGSPKSLQRLTALIAENLSRFAAGRPVLHLLEDRG